MIAGLPGTGLGGIFYLLASLVLIVREGVRWLRGNSSPRQVRLLLRLLVMTVLILAVLWGTYWMLDSLFSISAVAVVEPDATSGAAGTLSYAPTLPPFLIATLPVQIATILAILGSIEIASWLVRRARTPKTPRLAHSESADK